MITVFPSVRVNTTSQRFPATSTETSSFDGHPVNTSRATQRISLCALSTKHGHPFTSSWCFSHGLTIRNASEPVSTSLFVQASQFSTTVLWLSQILSTRQSAASATAHFSFNTAVWGSITTNANGSTTPEAEGTRYSTTFTMESYAMLPDNAENT